MIPFSLYLKAGIVGLVGFLYVKLKSLCIVWCALLTMGCGSQTTLSGVRQALPANLLTPCPDLPALDDGSAETTLRTLVEVSQLYYECQARHDALSAAVRTVRSGSQESADQSDPRN